MAEEQESIKTAIEAAFKEADDASAGEETGATAAAAEASEAAAAGAEEAAATTTGERDASGAEAETGEEAAAHTPLEFEQIVAQMREEGVATTPEGIAADGTGGEQTGLDAELDALDLDKALPEALVAPKTWPEGDRKAFDQLPAESRRFMLRREQQRERDYTKKTMELAPLRSVLNNWNPYIEAVGSDSANAVNVLLSTEWMLRNGRPEEKAAVISNLVGQYNIPLETLGVVRIANVQNGSVPAATAAANPALPANGGGDDYIDPDVAAALAPLQKQVSDLTGAVTSIVGKGEQERHTGALNSIKAFSEAKTEAGVPAHPFYDDVAPTMVELAQLDVAKGLQPDLKDLYDRACWATPKVREQILEAKKRQETAASKLDTKRRVNKAQKASLSLPANSSAREEKPMTLREMLEAEVPADFQS